MGLTYQDVVAHHNKIKDDLLSMLGRLEQIIIAARDNKDVPVYLTKYRIKNPESIYLKTKRKKGKQLDEIYDYAGMRILCLFEQDIFEVHSFLVECFSKNDFKLVKAETYNWDDDYSYSILENDLKIILPDYKIQRSHKPSGYKSIHYEVEFDIGKSSFTAEIQLRTLLQDVWGELEHALSYKQGSIHPHIRESFRLLAQDLQTNDSLMRHLKGISEKERCFEDFSVRQSGSPFYFGTESKAIPELFLTGRLSSLYEEYRDYIINGRNDQVSMKEWSKEARLRYLNIADEITGGERRDPKVKYWVEMEDAYFSFLEGDIDKALEEYKRISANSKYNDIYVPHFRMGEIYFKKGQIVKALVEFDKSDELLKYEDTTDYVNVYRVKTKLANIYWLLGEEYSDISVKLIEEARMVYEKNKECFDEKVKYTVLNNVCWYRLENYLLSKNNEALYNSAKEAYNQLKEMLYTVHFSSNGFDTAAWFCYQSYIKTGDCEWIDLAKKYCEEVWSRANHSTFTLTSINIQRNHLQEIMSAK